MRYPIRTSLLELMETCSLIRYPLIQKNLLLKIKTVTETFFFLVPFLYIKHCVLFFCKAFIDIN